MTPSSEVTQILIEWQAGDPAAFNRLFTLLYDELRALASGYMRRERSDHTLQTTALVNEAYVRLVRQSDVPLQNRLHFFAVAAKVMRQVLIDHARSRSQQKRGGGKLNVSLDQAAILSEDQASELIALDEALSELAKLDARQSNIVELRYFGGLTIAQTAEVLKISPDTVSRDWNLAKAWLYREIKG